MLVRKQRSVRRKNAVFSVRLRGGKFALVQTFSDNETQLAVYDEFRTKDDWEGFEPSSKRVLFYCHVLGIFFRTDLVSRKPTIKPAGDLVFPTQQLSINVPCTVTLWEGTKHERKIVTIGGSLSVCTTSQVNGRWRLEYKKITIKDYERWKHLETTGLRAYPEFNERLNLCAELGKNYDPDKELAFRRELIPEALVYVDIIGGKTPLAELGYEWVD